MFDSKSITITQDGAKILNFGIGHALKALLKTLVKALLKMGLSRPGCAHLVWLTYYNFGMIITQGNVFLP